MQKEYYWKMYIISYWERQQFRDQQNFSNFYDCINVLSLIPIKTYNKTESWDFIE